MITRWRSSGKKKEERVERREVLRGTSSVVRLKIIRNERFD